MKLFKLAITAAMCVISFAAHTKSSVYCLAENIYHEARNQPVEGQVAVAQVTLNRVHSAKFHNTVCEVVYAPYQFSWTSSKNKPIQDAKAWLMSLVIAQVVLIAHSKNPEFTATHFHARSVKPSWARKKKKVVAIGDHVFYAQR